MQLISFLDAPSKWISEIIIYAGIIRHFSITYVTFIKTDRCRLQRVERHNIFSTRSVAH